MRRLRQPAWKEELIGLQMRVCDPGRDRVPRLFGDLKLNRSLGLLLHDNRARSNVTALYHVVHMEPDPNRTHVTRTLLDREIEQRDLSASMIELQSNPDGPDFFQLQWRLLTERLPFVPWSCTSFGFCDGIHELLLC